MKNLIDNWWRDHFTTPPQLTIEVDNAEACKELASAGLGYTILPGLTSNNQDDLYCVPLISDTIKLKRNV
ncbi:hypothetical protein CSV69_16320 [Sporosarcina sp. P26b]|nr:hypothetical protein CSV69_16320 [Sporosarcina sp. P26b]